MMFEAWKVVQLRLLEGARLPLQIQDDDLIMTDGIEGGLVFIENEVMDVHGDVSLVDQAP